MLRGELSETVDGLLQELREFKGSGADLDIVCFDTEGFRESLAEFYELPLRKIFLQPSERTLEDLLTEWYGDPRKAKKLQEGLQERFGECVRIYTDEEGRMKKRIGKGAPFFFLFDYFFAEFREVTLAFTLGSND